jgi:hypothetical protein
MDETSNKDLLGNQEDVSEPESAEESEDQTQQRAKRYSKTPYGSNRGDPTQLQFYKGQWVDILEQAKQRFRDYVSNHCGFPERGTHLRHATNCLTEAMAAHSADGGTYDLCMLANTYSCNAAHDFLDYYDKYSQEMSILVRLDHYVCTNF